MWHARAYNYGKLAGSYEAAACACLLGIFFLWSYWAWWQLGLLALAAAFFFKQAASAETLYADLCSSYLDSPDYQRNFTTHDL